MKDINNDANRWYDQAENDLAFNCAVCHGSKESKLPFDEL